jgi:hypothetical protein
MLPELVAAKANFLGTASEIEFRWNSVPGANSYNVWLRKVPGVPVAIANTSGAAATVKVEPGTYEWFVEALIGGCPPIKSEAASLTFGRPRRRTASH